MNRFNRVVKQFGFGAIAVLAFVGTVQAGPHARVGVWIGGPMWWGPPAYSSSYYYGGYYPYSYSPYVVERPVILQQRVEPSITVAPNTAQASLWYYCADSRMYYPHVSQCASPWQEVPATPPPAPPR